MSKENSVECVTHGKSAEAFVCRHLLEGEGQGFHTSEDPDSFLFPDAWCDRCEEVRAAEGEWNDASVAFAGIKLICSDCYGGIRERNWHEDKDAFFRLVSSAVDDLNQKQARMRERYPIDECERYDWDQGTGRLVFSHDGRAKVVANIVFVGGVSTITSTWMWSWANESVSDQVKEAMWKVREFGIERGFLRLASACWSADECDGWEMTAVAAWLLGAEGAYRTPRDRGFTYMIIRQLSEVQ